MTCLVTFSLQSMIGKLANIAGDMNRIERFEEGRLKQLVSGDRVQVNRKHLPQVSVAMNAKFLFATNVMPIIRDRSRGIYRRMILMLMTEVFANGKENIHLISDLKAEAAGIANWCLAGLARLARQQQFTACEACNAAAAEHRLNNDPVLQFVDEKCEFVETHEQDRKLLYDAFVRWCKSNSRGVISSAEFYRQITAMPGVTERRPGNDGKRPRVFRGICLLASLYPYAIPSNDD